jgi:uncharacterized protein
MEPRLNVITLAVDDLERALVFYRDGLGLYTKGVVATDLIDEKTGAEGAIVIFKLDGGLTLALYPRSELAKDGASTRWPAEEWRVQPRSTGREPRRGRPDSRTGRCRRGVRDAAT